MDRDRVPSVADDPALAEALEQVPRGAARAIIETIEHRESHSGWLPSPDYLERYDSILPGLAERIVAMPEREQAHRHNVIERAIIAEVKLKRRGQWFALLSEALLLGFAIYLAWLGEYDWAGKIACFAVAAVVGIFVAGKVADIKLAKVEKEDD